MISYKMKEDAAKINSEIKIIATKMPLVFHNYNYLNEDAMVVLKRRNDQLDEMRLETGFINEIADFSNLLNDCKKEFKQINDELKELGMENTLDDDGATHESLECMDGVSEVKGAQYHNEMISRENNFVPDHPAILKRRNRIL